MEQADLDNWQKELSSSRPETGEALFWQTVADNTERWAREAAVGDFWRAVDERLPVWRQRWFVVRMLVAFLVVQS